MNKKMSLPSMEHTFSINVQGTDTGRYYDGTFTYVRPNLHKKSEIAKMSSRLNEDLKTLPEDIVAFNYICANLFFTITSFPDWWSEANYGRDLYDANVVYEIFKKVTDFENDWQQRILNTEGEVLKKTNEKK